MAKSARHKKLRKQEKAKTQLTGVRKLNKPQNVVEPTLKVKKIVIREQLKIGQLSAEALQKPSSSDHTDEIEITTRRKQSVQDLLSSVNHHNINMRKDAVVGLQEIATSQISTIIRHLDRIVAKIASLTSDQDDGVRKENLKLAEIVFTKVSADQLRPFWNMMVVHLKCSLTHLLSSVRYSVLSFVEILVQQYPTLVSESGSIILPSVLSLISTQNETSKQNPQKSKAGSGTRLKVEISGKHNDIKGRLKVLKMLSRCISIMRPGLQVQTSSQTVIPYNNGTVPEYLSLTYPFGYCWDQFQEKELCTKNFHQYTSARAFYSTITANVFSSAFNSESNPNLENFWDKFVPSCISVLLETWVEIGPSQNAESSGKDNNRAKKKQSDIGNDKDIAKNGRRNGLHILNEDSVDNLLSVVTLLEQLLDRSRLNSKSSEICYPNEQMDPIAKTIRKTQGSVISKYLFHLIPFVSLKETKKRDVASINLKLFLISGKLKMFDDGMKQKLEKYIEVIMESATMDKTHCYLILNELGFLEDTRTNSLPTRFLKFSSNIGYSEIVANYLRGIIHPSNLNNSNKSVHELQTSLKWNEIIFSLIQNWSESCANIEVLLEVLTFAGLRRLTEIKEILSLPECINKLKDLVNNSKHSGILDVTRRAFHYADAEEIFEKEFHIPINLTTSEQ